MARPRRDREGERRRADEAYAHGVPPDLLLKTRGKRREALRRLLTNDQSSADALADEQEAP
jgi:hypothetical protein